MPQDGVLRFLRLIAARDFAWFLPSSDFGATSVCFVIFEDKDDSSQLRMKGLDFRPASRDGLRTG
jgi:hypothetical protein